MSGGRWQRVESIAVAAMERSGHERSAFIASACGGDAGLQRDVESLLEFQSAADGFLAHEAIDEAARTMAAVDGKNLKIDGYEILDLLGAGGMGEVYHARDVRLERDVAVKVIHSAHETTTGRFEEEARVASALTHPNIVTIHAVGTSDDIAFIVMELVSGRTLRAILHNGPLSLEATLDIAVQLAEGLAAAHAIGIIHRDLKPDNVMVTPDGLVKILDFGIAKRERGFSNATASQAIRSAGTRPLESSTLAGTAGYMSPEQAARQPVDYRSDQFSFGAILYEMLAGQRAFERDTKSATVAAVIHTDPAPIEQLAAPPRELLRVLNRCLNKNPAGRYSNTRDLASDVRRLRAELTQTAQQRRLGRREAILLGTAAIVSAAAGAAVWWWRSPLRVAVLPFLNPAEDEDTSVLCDGVTSVLIRQLWRMPGVTVLPESTAFELKGTPLDPRGLGRQFDVDAVLQGSISRRGERASIRAELVDARTGTRIWGDEFNRPEADVLAIQTEIAAAIISSGLGRELSQQDRLRLNSSLTADPQAYHLFLRGIHYFRRATEDDYLRARDRLTEAIGRDPNFALAQLTLASTFSVTAIDGFSDPRIVWPRSRMHVDLALKADPDLPDAHAERAVYAFCYRWDVATAENEWNQALKSRRAEIQAELLSAYVLQQWALGRVGEALEFAKAAHSVDPLSPMLAMREADLLAASGDLSSAVTQYHRVIDNAAEPRQRAAACVGLADALASGGRFDDAIAAWRSGAMEADPSLGEAFSVAHGREGYHHLTRQAAMGELVALQERERSGAYVSPLDFARAHARLGNANDAFAFIAEAFEHKASGLVFLRVDRAWDSIRSDRRFDRYVQHVGLA